MLDKEDVLLKVEEIFKSILKDESIKLSYITTAENIENWDSFNHISIVMQIEKVFNVKFALGELQGLSNIGDMVDLILEKLM